MIAIPVIALALAVPVMVVLHSAAITIPIAMIKALSIIARSNPASGRVYRAAPISGMPSIVVPYGKPVTVHPGEFRAWTRRAIRSSKALKSRSEFIFRQIARMSPSFS